MNYINIRSYEVAELIDLRDSVVKVLESSDDEHFKEKLQEDIWDLNDLINRYSNN